MFERKVNFLRTLSIENRITKANSMGQKKKGKKKAAYN